MSVLHLLPQRRCKLAGNSLKIPVELYIKLFTPIILHMTQWLFVFELFSVKRIVNLMYKKKIAETINFLPSHMYEGRNLHFYDKP